MYVANFICDDRNGDDGIYNPATGDVETVRFTHIGDALIACADDAEAHAAMSAGSAEAHWFAAFTAAAEAIRATTSAAATLDTDLGRGYTHHVEGDDDGNGNAWALGHYVITLDPDAPNVTRTESGATINLNNDQCDQLRSVCDVIRQDDDDDAERAAIATLCDDLYRLLTPTTHPAATTAATRGEWCGECVPDGLVAGPSPTRCECNAGNIPS